MLFSATTLSSVLALAGLASAKFYKRATTKISLYTYGGTLGGLNVFYADGLAYVGSASPAGASVASNITFNEDPSDDTVAWTITANSTNASSIDGMQLYITPTSGSFTQVGFVTSTNTSLPTGAVTTGFSWFGKNAAYDDPSGAVNLFYWAEPVSDTDGLWRLMWNQAGTPSNGSVPVTLKNTAPLPVTPQT
ncbi:hypothetical protein DL95DRAFT_449242 [Leptodontidium sp. 2 PMI_412]|nr:hypothetical protein BKA61DRAFT_55753 [Leptodontidium sp. MPI-SDFR-AT-0119]KAH9209590.1 hypothetical protein DL95DRAFT_449242 [Leptodontidium sp. 2 PMI_412]